MRAMTIGHATAVAVSSFIGFGLATGPAAAQPLHRRHHPNVIVDVDQPPLTVNKRSWLDPGPVVPVGTEDHYYTANTIFEQTPDQLNFPSRFDDEALPRPLYPTGRPEPVATFYTPVLPY